MLALACGIGRRRESTRNESPNRSPSPLGSLNWTRPVGLLTLSTTLPLGSTGRPCSLVTRLSAVAYGRSRVGQPSPSDATALNWIEYGSAGARARGQGARPG